jgi:isocitrate dehydrogenase (NAD+)
VGHEITLIPGDGIGPEVAEAARRVVEATGIEVEWDVQDAGAAVMEREGTPLPDRVLASIRQTRTALKGPITTPVGTGFRSVNVALRQELDLFAAVRPALTLPGIPSRFHGVDVVVIRENTEDLYAGIEFEHGSEALQKLRSELRDLAGFVIRDDAGITVKPISVSGTRRIVRFAFDFARRNGRRLVTVGHKANIMKFSDGVFLFTAAIEAYGPMPAWNRKPVAMPTPVMSSTTKRFRTESEMVRPASTADRAMGSDRNRSIIPPARSSASPIPVWVEPNTVVCTKIPGIRKST